MEGEGACFFVSLNENASEKTHKINVNCHENLIIEICYKDIKRHNFTIYINCSLWRNPSPGRMWHYNGLPLLDLFQPSMTCYAFLWVLFHCLCQLKGIPYAEICATTHLGYVPAFALLPTFKYSRLSSTVEGGPQHKCLSSWFCALSTVNKNPA